MDNLRWRQDYVTAPVRGAESDEIKIFASANLVGHNIFLFGGQSHKGRKNTLHVYDIGKHHWTQITNEESQEFPTRALHTSVLVEDKLLMFAGHGEPFASNELLSLDLVLHEFETLACRGPKPNSALFHVSCFSKIRQSVMVFAPLQLSDGDGDFGELYECIVSAQEWRSVQAKGVSPNRRWGHAAALQEPRWFIYAQENPYEENQTVDRGLFVLDILPKIPVWSNYSLAQTVPKTVDRGMAFVQGMLVLHNSEAEPHKALHLFDPLKSNGSQYRPVADESEAEHESKTISGTFPLRRGQGVMVGSKNRIFLIGGGARSCWQNVVVLEPDEKEQA